MIKGSLTTRNGHTIIQIRRPITVVRDKQKPTLSGRSRLSIGWPLGVAKQPYGFIELRYNGDT